MRTKLRNHSEVAHVWASRSQEVGDAGNMSFRGDSIYSYGWWEMARFMEVKGETIVLMRNWNYSNSTAKHLGYVGRALRGLGYRRFYCRGDVGSGGYSLFRSSEVLNHDSSIQGYIEDIKESAAKLRKAIKNSDWHYRRMNSAFSSLEEYCRLFDLEFPEEANAAMIPEDEAQAIIKKRQERNKELESGADERRQKRREKLMRDNQEKIDEFMTHEQRWMDGENVSTGMSLSLNRSRQHYWQRQEFEFTQTRMRIKDGMVETSRGAYVTEREAFILWQLIKAGRDIKGHRVGNYTVIGINGTLKIGCHEISREEIDRFVTKYNW